MREATGGEQKQGRGRPKGSTKAAGAGAKKTKVNVDLRPLLATGFELLYTLPAMYFGKHWKLTDEQAQELAVRTDAVVKELSDDQLAGLMAWIEDHWAGLLLAYTVHTITTPRIVQTYQLMQAAKQARAEAAADESSVNAQTETRAAAETVSVH